MIIQSREKPDLILPDMTFWTMTINQPATEIYKNYKVLCPTILFSEIYNDVRGADKRLKKNFEVVYIDPWQILVKNELERQPIIQENCIVPVHLKSEQDMDKNEKEIVDDAKKLIQAFDNQDRFMSTQSPTLRVMENNAFVSFANASYQNLTLNQFIERLKKVSKGTFFEPFAHILEMPTIDKQKARIVIENALSQYVKMYPINNFKKAFAFSENMLKYNFIGICNNILIPMLEGHSEVDRTHWNKNRDKLTDSGIRKNFPYTWYALYHYLALRLYQTENSHDKKIGARDFEYLYYLYFPNILFVSADAQHEKYVTGAGLIKLRRHGSFAYIPHKNDDPDEHDRVMRYIKNGGLY